MNEARIRQIIREEMYKSNNGSRFNGITALPGHIHNGVDAPRIPYNAVQRNTPLLGNIQFSNTGDYIFNFELPQTPTLLTLNGNLFDNIDAPTVRYSVWGQAVFDQAYYFQPDTTRSVAVGGISYPTPTVLQDGTEANIPAQSSTFFGFVNGANAATAGDSQFHIVNVFGSATMRMTVTEFSRTKVVFRVTSLTSGYDLAANILIQ